MKNGKLLILIFLFLNIGDTDEAWAFLFWNQACSFSGSPNSYVAIPNSTSLNITSSFTIEAWIAPANSTSPAAQIIYEKRQSTFSNGYTLYLNSGRVAIRTNATTRLVGNTVVQSGVWTHIAGTYNASSNLFSVYVNNVLDSSVSISGADPVANSDSARIGKGNVNSPFAGSMDELRVWSKDLSQTELISLSRTSLGSSTGIYSQLELSLTFQEINSVGSDFTLTDFSNNGNSGNNNGVTAFDLGNRPSTTIALNDCIELNGSTDFLTGSDNAAVSPTNGITLEAWINSKSNTGLRTIIHKGQTTGAGVNYSLRISGAAISAIINGTLLNTTITIPVNVWTHVAFTYSASTGKYVFYINGRKVTENSISPALINNGSESLFIGSNGTSGSNFNGFIDEVRISNYPKTQLAINRNLFASIDQSNEPNPGLVNVVYNFDGSAYPNCDGGPLLNFVSTAAFAHPGSTDNQPVSPLNRSDINFFSQSFNLKTLNKKIPETGSAGTVSDSMTINLDTTITDLNLFVALNHTAEDELEITLVAPNGESVLVYDNQSLVNNSDNVITIFDDQADSNIANNNRFVSFGPIIKPKNSLAAKFNGDNSRGLWRLVVNDVSGIGTGMLLGWGLQLNNVVQIIPGMAVKVYMQGFYRETDSCVTDTITLHLKESTFPYIDVGIQDETPDEDFLLHASFYDADFGNDYYLVVEHRNSIQTWSASTVSFDFLSGGTEYDFTLSQDSAFGSNQIQVDSTPVRFAIYGGDVNQDSVVDLTDITNVFNDANIFAGGYVVTDVTGDDYVDLSDLTITFNNSNNFVSVIKP